MGETVSTEKREWVRGSINTYIYIYLCVCIYLCVRERERIVVASMDGF